MAGWCDLLFPPLRCLKSTIFGGTIATVVVGVLSIFSTNGRNLVVVYAFLISSIWTQFNRDIRNELITIILCSSIMITIIGVSGIYGITNNKPCFLCLYSLGSIIFMLLFLTMGVFATIYPEALSSSCQKSQDNTTKVLQQGVDEAQGMLCKDCGCYFITMNDSTIYNSTGGDWDDLEQKWLRDHLTNTTGNDALGWDIAAQNCTQWTSNASSPNIDTLSLLEGIFSCSGWCEQANYPNLYYLFTNVNQGNRTIKVGKPKDFCYNQIVNFFKKFGSLLEISSYLVAAVLFVVFATTLCLCCHPKRLNPDANVSLKERLLQINAAILNKTDPAE